MKKLFLIIPVALIIFSSGYAWAEETSGKDGKEVSITESKKKRSSRYHSPWIAAGVSILPLWSGSFNAEFNKYGVPLALVKTYLYYMVIDLTFIKKTDIKDTYLIYALWGASIIGDMVMSYFYVKRYNKKRGYYSMKRKTVSFAVLPRIHIKEKFNNETEYKYDGVNMAAIYRF